MMTCMLLAVFVLQLAVVKTQNADVWRERAQNELKDALKMTRNTNVAKNVIFFLGDGMGVSTVTAGRIYKGQQEGRQGEEDLLSFEKFPSVALSKTYNTDSQTADSAGTATAFLCGVKANIGTIGLDARIPRFQCDGQDEAKVTSILKWTLDEGKSAGLVTTARVTHATPAASYAHAANRDWESDVDTTRANVTGKCKDIALQLLDNLDLQVVLGGGRRSFLPSNMTDPGTKETDPKQRLDLRNLPEEWKSKRTAKGQTAEYVWKKSQFDAIDASTTDNLIGLFTPSNMNYDINRDSGPDGEPSLAEMTKKAIDILKKNNKGYFLLVEGGRIDHGHHENKAKLALHDTVAFDAAVETAVQETSESDTLIVVSADHSHVFNIGGYPKKGTNILGFAHVNTVEASRPSDGMPKTTLVYGNGPGYGRENLTGVDTADKDYVFTTAVKSIDETHGGEDVAIYARGPMSHLFHSVHEQNYIAHVMAYASCVGTNKDHCKEKPKPNTGHRGVVNTIGLSLAIFLSLVILH